MAILGLVLRAPESLGRRVCLRDGGNREALTEIRQNGWISGKKGMSVSAEQGQGLSTSWDALLDVIRLLLLFLLLKCML